MRSQRHFVRILIATALIAAGCSRQIIGPKANTVSGYCGSARPVSGAAVTVTGTAKFENLTLGTCGGICAFTVTPSPIRYAEVRALSSSGEITQCGETDNTGAFSLDLPQSSGGYTIYVSSRSNNSKLQAYVMNDNINNAFYTVSTTVGSDASQTGISMLAPSGSATSRTAGAFSILDKLLTANEFLRKNTAATYTAVDPDTGRPVGGCSNGSYFPNCQPFTVGPLAYAYWTKGVNPAGTSSGVSYYVPGTSSLYILGGLGGAVDGQDSDEFDSSVIIHEYGHFLEEHYGHSDSPGGSHNGDTILDPRLAWSEGWADFFQAAVRGENTYADVRNVSAGMGQYQIYEYLSAETTPTVENPSHDLPQAAGEGTFREFSVTRVLWAVLKTNTFSQIWSVFSGSSALDSSGQTNGFHDDGFRFRNISLLHKIQAANHANTGSTQAYTSWSTQQTAEDQYPDLRAYAAPLAAAATCSATQSLNPATSFDMHAADKFYDFTPSYSGTHTLTLSYLTPHSQRIDVDLYVMSQGYTYACTLDYLGRCLSQSNVVRKNIIASNTESETYTTATAQDCLDAQMPTTTGLCATYDKAIVTLNADLGAGLHYMINPSAYTFAVSTRPLVYFTLSINGQNECPQP